MKNPINLYNKGWQFAVLILLSIIWGTSFILMKRGLEVFTSLQVGILRVSIGFLTILPFSIRYLHLITRKNLKSILVAGYCGIAIPAILFATAQKHLDSSMAGVLNSLTPMFTLIVGLLLYRTPFRLFNFIGIFIGFIGATSLIIKTKGFEIDNINYFALLIVLATALYGINVNEIKSNLSQLSGLQVTALSFVVIGPVAIGYLLFSGFLSEFHQPHFGKGILAVAVLAIFGSVFAVWLFNYFLKYTTAVFASSVTYIIPVFAILWGIFDGERFGMYELLSVLVILAGVWLVNKNGKKEKK